MASEYDALLSPPTQPKSEYDALLAPSPQPAQTFAAGSPREIAREQLASQPVVQQQIQRAGSAIGETAIGFVKGLPSLAKFIKPPSLTDILTGVSETVGQIKQAEQAPVGSQQWWNAVVPVASQYAMQFGGVRASSPRLTETLLGKKPPIQETPLAAERAAQEEVIKNATQPDQTTGGLPTEQGKPTVTETKVQPQARDTRQTPAEVAPQEVATVPPEQPQILPTASVETGRPSPTQQTGIVPRITPQEAEPLRAAAHKWIDNEFPPNEFRTEPDHARIDRIVDVALSARTNLAKGGLRMTPDELKAELNAALSGHLSRADISPFVENLGGLDLNEGGTPVSKSSTVAGRNEPTAQTLPVQAGEQAPAVSEQPKTTEGGVVEEVQKADEGQRREGVLERPAAAVSGAETPPAAAPPEKIAAPPKVNLNTGGSEPPPPGSVIRPDTPPGSNPEKGWASRLALNFRNWWEKEWPRSYAAVRTVPDTPVMTIHQNFIKEPVDFMENFADQPWWKNIKSMEEHEIIDAEDQAVSRYRTLLDQGVDPNEARTTAINESPLREVFQHREQMIPQEIAAADALGVERPGYTGDPYLARLTNEEGKEIVDVTPSIQNLGSQLRRSIGHFDNSRVHPTMKSGIDAGTQYDPVVKAVWMREKTGQQLIATANAVKALREGGVLYDTKAEALAASPDKSVTMVRGLGTQPYWARTRQEAKFIQQNFSSSGGRNPLSRLNQLGNAYIRNPSLINPLPHVTKNMFFKYILARVGNATFKADTAEFAAAKPSALKSRFDKVFPVRESSVRMPQLTAREVGNWAEKISSKGLGINQPSQKFIFEKADPAMRFALWKSYVKKGMSDQEAANHVFLDLIRYDENSGGLNFWKSIPFNYFSTWRTGTYVTMAKALRSHPIRALLFFGAVEYMREMIYRKTGTWTHLPIDYINAPLAELVDKSTRVPEQIRQGKSPFKSAAAVPESAAALAATTFVFGPGGGQAPSTIRDVMSTISGDPSNRARVQNMFWGLSQIFNIPQEYLAYKRDRDPKHLAMILSSAALGTHSALKYEPRRLGKWLPEWMPGMQKSELVNQAENLQERIRQRAEKSQATYQSRHGITRGFYQGSEQQQLEDLGRAARPQRQSRQPFAQ